MAPSPPRSHPRRNLPRAVRTLLAALVIAAVAVPMAGAARPSAVPAPAPAALAPLRAATPAALADRYAVNRGSVLAAERMAARHGDGKRAAALRGLADPARHFFSFDGRDGGRSVEVFGDLSRARRIAVLVPGAGISLDRYWRLRAGAVALRRELGEGAAVIAWLGYETPDTVSRASVTTGRAKGAATELRTFIAELKRAEPTARISLLCHSYGSVVCARGSARAGGLGHRPVRQPRHRRRQRRRTAHPGHRLGRPRRRRLDRRGPARTAPTAVRHPSGSAPTRSPRRSVPGTSRRATAATATT